MTSLAWLKRSERSRKSLNTIVPKSIAMSYRYMLIGSSALLLLAFLSVKACFASYEDSLDKAISQTQNAQSIQKLLKEFEQQFQANVFLTTTKTSLLKNPLSFPDYCAVFTKDAKTPAKIMGRVIKKMFVVHNKASLPEIGLKFNLEAVNSPLKEIIQTLLDQINLVTASDFEITLAQAQALVDTIDKKIIPELQNVPASSIKNIVLQSSTDPKVVIAIGNQDKNDYRADENHNFLLIIDFGGNDNYYGAVAAPRFPLKTGIVIDLAGNDRYLDEKGDVTQGAGINGVGMLVDLQGDDVYVGAKRAQGYGGMNGVGILWDKSGNDRYVSYQYSQGAAGSYFPSQNTLDDYVARTKQEGFGLLLDNQGNDVYNIENNQAELSAQSPGFSNAIAQGAAIGDRSLGALIDLDGDDIYSSTVIAQGAGWNQGLGILYDERGNDSYTGVHYVMGASAHRGFGAFFDLAGKDRYSILDGQGAGASTDTGMASFVDDGSENDTYFLKGESGGTGMNNSFATFIDESGDESYDGASMGRSDLSGYPYRGFNLGIFIDSAGKDFYSDDGKHGRLDVNGKCTKTESGSEEAKHHSSDVNGLFCDW